MYTTNDARVRFTLWQSGHTTYMQPNENEQFINTSYGRPILHYYDKCSFFPEFVGPFIFVLQAIRNK